MDHFLSVLAANQLCVIALAGVLWIVGKWGWISERPALVHGLWLLVFVKCVTPPLIRLPIFPNVPPQAATETQSKVVDAHETWNSLDFRLPTNNSGKSDVLASPLSMPSTDEAVFSMGAQPTPAPETTISRLVFVAFVASLLVSGFMVCIAALRMRTIGRLLRDTDDASNRAVNLLRDAGRHVGVNRLPGLVVVDAAISPMLWAGFCGTTIILPQKLVETIEDERLLHILIHELAHFVRRDHVSNFFAFLVASLFWWNPVLWLARRQLHSAAEASCDALTIERLTDSRRVYAETLVMVVDYVASSKPYYPTVATSFGESHLLKRRIEMIADSRVKSGLSRVCLFVLVCAVAVLPFLPARAQDKSTQSKPKADTVRKQPIVTGDPESLSAGSASQKPDAENSSSEEENEFTTSWMASAAGPVKNPRFRLPDYLPAAHGNMVEIAPKHFFHLTPLGSTHKWHVIYGPGGWDEILTIPALKDLKQGQTFDLHKNEETSVVAFVEAEYANDRDIGVRIIDNATDQVKHQCTLLMNVSRYQWVADVVVEKGAK